MIHRSEKQQTERATWFSDLEVPHKQNLLFEMETLIKAVSCYLHPRNRIASRFGVSSRRNFAPAMFVLGAGIQRIGTIAKDLLVERRSSDGTIGNSKDTRQSIASLLE